MTQSSQAARSELLCRLSPHGRHGLTRREAGAALAALTAGAALPLRAQTPVPVPTYGTFETPFAAHSPWNLRPIAPVLGTVVVPTSSYYPTLAEGTWSTGVFKALASDPAVTVYPLAGQAGVWDPDSEIHRPSITIPRWPANVKPAAGSDAHGDIIDEAMGIVHSFFQLKLDGRTWRAGQYAWAPLKGRGWGEPAHYYQGARAVGVPAIGGVIRRHEIDDGLPYYRHALAMSLTFNGLAANPAYIFPATSADAGAANNTGGIPEGALMMLPATYDTARIQNVKLRKVAETLKRHGAYVVDRNYGTPFVIYVENGSNFNLMPYGWDNATATELDRMRAALRQVMSVSSWQDGFGNTVIPEQRLNLLSMRGQWSLQRGTGLAVYDTWKQAVVFPAAATADVLQVNYSSRVISNITWARPVAGAPYRLTARTTGGGRLRLALFDNAGVKLYDSGELADGALSDFNWPAGTARTALYAYSGPAGTQATVGGTLISNAPLTALSGKILMK